MPSLAIQVSSYYPWFGDFLILVEDTDVPSNDNFENAEVVIVTDDQQTLVSAMPPSLFVVVSLSSAMPVQPPLCLACLVSGSCVLASMLSLIQHS